MNEMVEPLGPVIVLDIETAPDPAVVAIAGRGREIDRAALHRLVAVSMLVGCEDADGWGSFELVSAATDDEMRMLKLINRRLEWLHIEGGTLLTYNGVSHDFTCLRRRRNANWAFDLAGIAALGDIRHFDLMRMSSRGPLKPWPSLRDSCAALGIPMNHLLVPSASEPRAASVRKSQADVVGTFLLFLFETAAARASAASLSAGWRALSKFLGEPAVRAPHLEQFRAPFLLGLNQDLGG
ncbi:hypothetical protein PQ455_13415 [Sphingomonas naphthae]|uniref:Uncharacterized protein n=1 Tax=Sphingomonas naphthae TaxID=1813468 RepID=A0ABY7TIK0_9SPHN|nr:hypothetical protein [Sphingomonas naphthae]WCT72626.1 hypothetical protein PQ455_13415 [Sphingomonas naphthae]